MQFWETGQTFAAQLPEVFPKKVHKRCKNFSKTFSSTCSHGEVASILQDPLTFYGQPAESFPLDIKKKQSVSFAKNFHPKFSIETENPVSTNPLAFSARIGQNDCSESKKEKKN